MTRSRDAHDELPEPSSGVDTAPRAPMLEGRELLKRYDTRSPALNGVSLSVSRGEMLVILGRSGSGKSTLLLCLAGVLPLDAGEVRFGNLVLGDLSDDALASLRRREFGFVFQFGHLLPELTALENVALPLRLNGAERASAEATALAMLSSLGMQDLADRPQGRLSGGEGQRVAVARALVTDPGVIFADEPTGALDSENGQVVMQLLVSSARERGSTVVIVTHDLQVASFGDRVISLVDGRVDSIR